MGAKKIQLNKKTSFNDFDFQSKFEFENMYVASILETNKNNS